MALTAFVVASGCQQQQAGGSAGNSTPDSHDGKKTMTEREYRYGDALIDSVDIARAPSGALELTIAGSLRDGCSELHAIKQKRAGDTLRIQVVTRRPIDMMCTQALVPFTRTVTLDTDGLDPGRYRVAVDGVEAMLEIPSPE